VYNALKSYIENIGYKDKVLVVDKVRYWSETSGIGVRVGPRYRRDVAMVKWNVIQSTIE
jgi:hypothetical protein